MSVMTVTNLTKDYGGGKGVFDLNFTINEGEVFGYLGPNGAGKTTTIRHLLGFLNADKGSCTIGGLDCRTKSAEIQKDLGFLAGEIAFFDDMRGIDFLKFSANMRGLTNYKKMNELIEMFELNANVRIKKMSKGMKQKVGIVNAFMHNPTTLILDEPTSGLDPLMQNKFVQLILKEKSEGKTILMSSHSFDEVSRTCDKIGIIKAGRFVDLKTADDLHSAKRKLYTVTLPSKEQAVEFSNEQLEVVSVDKNIVTVAVNGSLKPLTTALGHYEIMDLASVTQSLEEVFMAYYGGDKNV